MNRKQPSPSSQEKKYTESDLLANPSLMLKLLKGMVRFYQFDAPDSEAGEVYLPVSVENDQVRLVVEPKTDELIWVLHVEGAA
jgi:hypothetical protein